jgi:trigger factor
LKIEKEYRDDHQVKLTVELETGPFESAKRRAARQIAKRIKIPGFRPGKAPYGVILRQVGEGNIVEQALEILIEEQYPEIIKEAEIEPYGPGTLENVPELDPPTLEFIVPLDSEVVLGDYKSISKPYETPVTSDEDVDSALQQIREQHAARESVERSAEKGDIVFMRVSGVRNDVEDEDEATIVEERFSSSIIKENEEEGEWPFPGFSKELVGLSAEDEKTISYKYPEDHKDEDLQGVQAEFKIVVTNIQSQVLPEINDELAKNASEFETLEEWKADLKVNLTEQALATYAEEYDDQVLDHIISESTIKFPPQVIEREKEEILRGIEYRLAQQGLNKDLYLQIRGLDEEGLDDEITPVAEERVKRALVLMKIAKAEEIQADPEGVQLETRRTVDAISSSMTPNEAKKFTKSAYIPNLMGNILVDMVTQKTMDYLRATAKGEPWPSEEDQPEEEMGEEQPTEEVQADGESTNEAEVELLAEDDPSVKAEESDLDVEVLSEGEDSSEDEHIAPETEVATSEAELTTDSMEKT